MELFAENWPLLLILVYVFWDWRTQQNGAAEIATMREELETSRREMDAILAEVEQVNAGFLRFLKKTKNPEGIALRNHIEALQVRIANKRAER